MSQYKAIVSSLILFLIVVTVFVFADGYAWLNSDIEQHIFVNIRLPVLLTATAVGGAISISAAALQILLRNPLADPGIIGISAGASLMAAIVLLTGSVTLLPSNVESLSYYVLPIACFIGALLSSFMIYALARKLQASMSAVILAGIGISTIAGAIIGWLFIYAPPQSIKNLSFWLMGSLHNTNFTSLGFALPIIGISMALLIMQGQKLNWLYLGGASAQLKGIDPVRFERKILALAALLVGVSVSIAGSIAFIGLLIPHFVRQLVGHDNRLVLPVSALMGASLLIMTAIINEWLFDMIVPVSMLTATLGGPLFIYSLLRQPSVLSNVSRD
jgi:ABC-type Fe3+-siderophore transport system permease subunit